MKIVFVLPDMPGGGSERVVANLSNEYVKRGYEVDILLFAGKRVAYELDDRVRVVITGEESGGNPLVRIKRIINMRRYYKANRGAYIYSFCVMGTVFSVIAAFGIPHYLLVSERNDPTMIPKKQQIVRDWSYKKAKRLVFQTEDMMKLFPSYAEGKSLVIPNPVSDNIPKRFEGERSKRIVNVARLEAQKNQALLIRAFSSFVKKHEDYSLEIYGQGPLKEELDRLSKELGISDKVILKGFSSNVKEEILDAAMFVLSSDYEGISNSMIEALAMGIPVISTDCPVGGSKMYIENEINGLLVPIKDEASMAAAMERLATDKVFAQKLGLEAVKIKDKYGLESIADRFLEASGLK